MDDESFDLDSYPDARAAFDTARDLARRAVEEAAMMGHNRGGGSAARELARFKARLPARFPDPMALARVRRAVEMGETQGRGEADGERRERTVFPLG